MRAILTCIFLVLNAVSGEVIIGRVVSVSDGDTITILDGNNNQIRVRLEGIDCPESKQDYGTKARQLTVDLCFQKEVRVKKTGVDKYGRTLGHVYINGVCLNEELLRKGMAWHYKQYNKDPELAEMETIAKKNKVGLWKMQNPIAPWDFRRNKSKKIVRN